MKTKKMTSAEGKSLTTLIPETEEDMNLLSDMESKGRIDASSFSAKRARAKSKWRRKASEWIDETCKFASDKAREILD